MKERAGDLGIRSRLRERRDGCTTGGNPFERGHIHHILRNPVYAGRIRHKGQVYDGQHPAIIDPEVWEGVQNALAVAAARARGTKRLRYYISRRLVTDRSAKHPDAWRLPADQIEGLLIRLVRQHLGRPNAAGSLVRGISAAEILTVSSKLVALKDGSECLALVRRADLRPGSIVLQLDRHEVARLIDCHPDKINPDQLTIEVPFRTRRRGVELKLHLGDAPREIDQTIVRNIVKARRWLAMIIDGMTFDEIAHVEGTSKRRVQAIVDLATLAPDFLDAIAKGEQPAGLTSDYLIKTGFPAIWSEQ